MDLLRVDLSKIWDKLLHSVSVLFWFLKLGRARIFAIRWIGHFRVLLCVCFKASVITKPFLWKWFWFPWYETACRTHIHKKGFPLRLVLKQRCKRTPKWHFGLTGWDIISHSMHGCLICGRMLKCWDVLFPKFNSGTLFITFQTNLSLQNTN